MKIHLNVSLNECLWYGNKHEIKEPTVSISINTYERKKITWGSPCTYNSIQTNQSANL